MKYIVFQPSIFRGYVSFREGIPNRIHGIGIFTIIIYLHENHEFKPNVGKCFHTWILWVQKKKVERRRSWWLKLLPLQAGLFFDKKLYLRQGFGKIIMMSFVAVSQKHTHPSSLEKKKNMENSGILRDASKKKRGFCYFLSIFPSII